MPIATTLIQQALDQLVYVSLEITCWSGKKTVTPEDLGLDRNNLPPETLVSLGDKQLIDPNALRAFTSLRSSARRACLAVGTRFMGGYAVPVGKAQALLDKLDKLAWKYKNARTHFLAGYDGQIKAWIQQQPPEWQPMLQDAVLLAPAEYVGGRLKFAVQAVQVSSPAQAEVVHDGFTEAVQGLGEQVFHEIGQLARETLAESFQGKTSVTRRAANPLRAIRDKIAGLVFVDSRLAAVLTELDRSLAAIPSTGSITGTRLGALRQFLCLASQPDGLQAFAANAALPNGGGNGWVVTDDRELAFAPAQVEAEAETEVEVEADAEAEVEAEAEAEVESASDWFF